MSVSLKSSSKEILGSAVMVLSPHREKLNNGLGLVFLAISGLSWALDWVPSESQLLSLNLVSYLLFLNLVHVGFTFALLRWVPEIRAVGSYKRGATSNWILWLVVSGGVGVALIFAYGPRIPRLSKLAIYYLWLIVSIYHVLGQVGGYLSQYNFRIKSRLSGQNRLIEKFDQTVKHERLLFRLFTLFILIPPGLRAFEIMKFVDATLMGWIPICLSISALAFLLLLANMVVVAWRLSIYKLLYVLRISLYLLAPFNLLVGPILQSLHGVEYGLFVAKIVRFKYGGDSRAWARFWVWGWSLGLLCAGLIIVGPFTKWELFLAVNPIPLAFGMMAYIVGKTIQFAHFYIDGFIYKFSEPRIARTVGPLALGEST